MTRGKEAELNERSLKPKASEGAEKLTAAGKQIEEQALNLSASKAASPEGDEALTQIARRWV
jgi:hypothetical protein